jgi:glucose-1-phosphate thymidylyltransferase
VDIAASLKSAARGEIDIMTVNNVYLERNALHVCRLSRGYAWFDAGTHESLYDASSFVRAVERRQGMQIACLEEIAMESGWLTPDKILARADLLGKTPYAAYLRSRVEDLGL